MKNITKKVQAYLSTFAPYLKTKKKWKEKWKKLKIILFLSEIKKKVKNIKKIMMKLKISKRAKKKLDAIVCNFLPKSALNYIFLYTQKRSNDKKMKRNLTF